MNSYRINTIIIIICVLLPLLAFSQVKNKILRYKFDLPVCELPGLNEKSDNFYPHIPKSKRVEIPIRESNISFLYSPNVPQDARVAMEEGVRPILDDFINSQVPIIISVEYAESSNPNTLASAGPTGWYNFFPNVPKIGVFYPVALAEKIARRDLNGEDEIDIRINVNSTQEDWYYDFQNPGGIGNKFDFVSVILHEVIHGLGFNGATFVTENNIGTINNFTSDGYTRYTDKMYLSTGVKVSDVSESTTDMGFALTGDNLFFRIFSQDEDAKLFAPSPYQPGSSVSHLDNIFNNSENSLMTPSASRGAIERQLGITEDILNDLGWSFTYVLHTVENKIENPIDQPFNVEIKIESDAGSVKEEDLLLHFSNDMFLEMDSIVTMTQTSQDSFSAFISSLGEEGEVQYYFEVKDARNNTFLSPGTDVDDNPLFYTYFFGDDKVPPIIMHDGIEAVDDSQTSVLIECFVDDEFMGVDSVFVEWRLNGTEYTTTILAKDENNQFVDNLYTGIIDFDNELVAGDEIEYKLVAVDKAKAKNITRIPRGSRSFKIVVVPALKPVYTYINDFDTESDDFTGDFTINKFIGFIDPALHSPHPYDAAGDNATINYITELKVPIIVDDEYPIIQFDEIVLVEQGEPGTVFGQTEFWDYVIVEARKKGEVTWKQLLDGYDCSANDDWFTAYTSGIPSGQNDSGTPGDLSLFKDRQFDITESGVFKANDTISIRFRLFSDEAAVGWGWCIDNLRIQELATSIFHETLENSINIYPNPTVGDQVFVDLAIEDYTDVILNLFSTDGKLLFTRNAKTQLEKISLPKTSSVFYLNIVTNAGIITRRIMRME